MFQSFSDASEGAAGPDRLALLRDAMSAAKVDAFLVPRADAHQGEYVAPRDERLAWLTGFTGSAGFAIALADRAAIFVDGRYTLQAELQVDPVFERLSLTDEPPSKWLGGVAGADAKIAYDPWLHPMAEVRRFESALPDGAELTPLASNLIDDIWPDQPPAPAAAIRPQPEAFAGEASHLKRARLGETLAAEDVGAFVLTLPDSIAWLLNIRGGDIPRNPVPLVFAILRAGGAVTLFAEAEQIDGALREHLGREVSILPRAEFARALAALDGERVGLARGSCPVAIKTALDEAGADIVWRDDPCVLPKAKKNAVELEGARTAHKRDGAAVARFLRWLSDEAPNGELSEISIARRLETERRATNALLDISFDTISGSGPNGAIVHYQVTEATDRTLAPGELMLVDSG
ncbi:MAG: aminopeptidase P family N-terminal domain-containing protein, partial [Pseudomonadota bacterium]